MTRPDSHETCDHEHHDVDASIVALDDGQGVHRYLAELRITCTECGHPFGFKGLPCGVSVVEGAMVDPSATELRVVLYSPSELALLGPLPGLTEGTTPPKEYRDRPPNETHVRLAREVLGS